MLASDLGISPPVDIRVPDAIDPFLGGPEVEIPLLHSNPSAPKKIYLDFNGQIVSGTGWNGSNNNLPIHAPPYSSNADIFTFTQAEINQITEIWNRVSEDFAPFQVDVTTEDPGAALFAAGNQGIRAIISTDVDDVAWGGTGNQWFSGAGGVAYLNSWTFASDTPVWIFENNLGNGNAKYVAEAVSHEVGHALNLSHDGVTGGASYYSGHGSGTVGWAPIMGVGYYQNVSQWSRGEYTNANQTQNDLSIISGKLPYRTDDHGSVKTNAAAATPLPIVANVVSQSGIIERTADVDVFRLDLSTNSNVIIDIDPWFVGPNLDILAELYNSAGTLVASNNPTSLLDARISGNLPAGVYTLAIDGTSYATPTTGYSDYASLGRYSIVGTVIPNDPNPGGPFVNATPVLDSTTAPTKITIPFSEPLQSASLVLSDFIFGGPGGANLQAALTNVTLVGGQNVELTFQPQTAPGNYALVIGPDILDTLGNAMDQDRDGIYNEIPDDYYIFTFSLTQAPIRGDFNGDQQVNVLDIDLLCAAIQSAANPAAFDLTADGSVNMQDMDEMILNVVDTLFGDANLDRVVDGSDFNLWNAGKFQAGGWGQGDFNCDGLVDGSDFNVWNSNKFQAADAKPGRSAIVASSPVQLAPALGRLADPARETNRRGFARRLTR